MTVRYLDPTVVSDAMSRDMAARVAGLDGKTVGLLANGKANGDRLLKLVADGLAARYTLRGVVIRAKDNASRPAPSELIEELVAIADIAVTAIGD
jgi:hypothetical protein